MGRNAMLQLYKIASDINSKYLHSTDLFVVTMVADYKCKTFQMLIWI